MIIEKLKENWILIVSGLALILFIFFKNNNFQTNDTQLVYGNPNSDELDSEINEDKVTYEDDLIFVEIKGEIKEPGVYEIDRTARIDDVVKLAGGFSEDANELAVNQAQRVQDEMSIVVPSLKEESNGEVNVAADVSDKIKINYASQAEIETLKGIGPSKAADIIQHREEHGLFNVVEDLLEVSGIGEKTLENFKDDIQIP